MTTPSPVQTNPVGAGVLISGAAKSVLVALAAIHVVPWTGEQVGTVGLALAGVIDVLIYFGLIRPRLAAATEDRAQTLAMAAFNNAMQQVAEQTQPIRQPTRMTLPQPTLPPDQRLLDPRHRWTDQTP